MYVGKRNYWLFQLAGWGCFFLFQLFLVYTAERERFATAAEERIFLQRTACFVAIGIFVSHFIRIIIIRLRLLNKRLFEQILWFLFLTILMALVSGVLEIGVFKILNMESQKETAILKRKNSGLLALINAAIWFFYYFIWNSMYLMYHYIVINKQQQIDTLKLKAHVKELELKTIKTHINPHFIFNALNGIRAMVDENPQRARTAITELSNILRSSINIDKSETVPLTDELNIIKDYLALEQMRFEDRLMIQYDVEDKTTNQPVPPMMLQMLVENAIKHGISHEINGGLVKLVGSLSDNVLELRVENTGVLREPKAGEGGFGIMSIQERLKLMYGSNASFNIKQSSPDTVTATLKLPVTL